MEIRSHKSLENDGVLHQEDLPIDQLVPAIDRLRIYLGLQWTPDRSAPSPRSIGALIVILRRNWPIDRLLWRDRSAMALSFSAVLQILVDRSVADARPIGDGSAFCSSILFRSRLLHFVCFFYLDFHICA